MTISETRMGQTRYTEFMTLPRLAGSASPRLTHKKDLQALEQKRKNVADLRRIWITKRQPFIANHLERLAFIPLVTLLRNALPGSGRNLSQDQHG